MTNTKTKKRGDSFFTTQTKAPQDPEMREYFFSRIVKNKQELYDMEHNIKKSNETKGKHETKKGDKTRMTDNEWIHFNVQKLISWYREYYLFPAVQKNTDVFRGNELQEWNDVYHHQKMYKKKAEERLNSADSTFIKTSSFESENKTEEELKEIKRIKMMKYKYFSDLTIYVNQIKTVIHQLNAEVGFKGNQFDQLCSSFPGHKRVNEGEAEFILNQLYKFDLSEDPKYKLVLKLMKVVDHILGFDS